MILRWLVVCLFVRWQFLFSINLWRIITIDSNNKTIDRKHDDQQRRLHRFISSYIVFNVVIDLQRERCASFCTSQLATKPAISMHVSQLKRFSQAWTILEHESIGIMFRAKHFGIHFYSSSRFIMPFNKSRPIKIQQSRFWRRKKNQLRCDRCYWKCWAPMKLLLCFGIILV